MSTSERGVQSNITSFWTTIAPFYNSDPGNVPKRESAEYEAWVRAIENLLPQPPSDVLDIGTGTGFVALIASRLGHRATGIDLSEGMLAVALKEAEQCHMTAQFEVGDAVAPPFAPGGFDAIVCRHLLWTLREPEAALANWLGLLRPGGRLIVIDGLWRLQPQPEPEDGFDLFAKHYTAATREALPAMSWSRAEQAADLVRAAGFSGVTLDHMADVFAAAEHPQLTEPWYVVTGFHAE